MRSLTFRAFFALLTALTVLAASYRADAPHAVVVALAHVAQTPQIHTGPRAEADRVLLPRPSEVAKAPRRPHDSTRRVAEASFVRTASSRGRSVDAVAPRQKLFTTAPSRLAPPGRIRARLMVFLI